MVVVVVVVVSLKCGHAFALGMSVSMIG